MAAVHSTPDVVTPPAPQADDTQCKHGCRPPVDDYLTQVWDRRRAGERWVCGHGTAWVLSREPSGSMTRTWTRLHGFAEWRARRITRRSAWVKDDKA